MKQSTLSKRITKCIQFYAFNREGVIIPVSCGQWSCPECAKTLARKWAARVKLHVQIHGPAAYFWTLTLRPSIQTAKDGYRALPKLWDTFRKMLQRYYGEKWDYCAFVEAHPQRGHIPHFHIISMRPIPYVTSVTDKKTGKVTYIKGRIPREQRNTKLNAYRKMRLKDLAMRAGFGYQADDSVVTGHKAASYVAKYASKTEIAIPKGFRRVRATRNWAKLPDIEGPELIVKSQKETDFSYIMRVHDITGIDVEKLYEIWRATTLDTIGE